MYGSDFLTHYSLAVAVTFGLLALLGWLATRYGHKLRNLPRGKSSAGFEVLGRVGLTPQHQVHHVRFRHTEFLIATGPQGSTLLHTFPSKKPK